MMENTTTGLSDLISLFEHVAPAVNRRLEAVATDFGQKLVAEPSRQLFTSAEAQDIVCRSWKIMSRLGVAFTLDLIGSPDQGAVLLTIDGSPVLEFSRRGDHANELAGAQVGLALDVALLEAA